MKTFAIGQLEIDVLSHIRVDGSRFPRPDPSSIADYFVVEARWQGAPIDFYPNQGKPAEPLAFGFIGAKAYPAYAAFDPVTNTQITKAEALSRKFAGTPFEIRQVGTRRGGDFRGGRFWRVVARRLAKAILAAQLGKTVSDVTSADEARAGVLVRRLLTANFADPVDTRAMPIDDAIRFLRDADGDIDEGEKPPGTVANIDVAYDGSVNSTASDDFDTGGLLVSVNTGANTYRTYLRFSLAAISAGATINDTDFQFNCDNGGAESGEGVNVKPYADNNGNTNPEGEAGSTKYSNCAAASDTYASIDCNTTGSKTADLGASADARVSANLDDSDILSIGLTSWNLDFGDTTGLESLEDALGDPITLTVDYTAASTALPVRPIITRQAVQRAASR